jgi:hypothetical protein
MKKLSNDDEADTLNRACFTDFLAGLRLETIASRYGIDLCSAEEHLRRGLYDFGFSSATLATLNGATSTTIVEKQSMSSPSDVQSIKLRGMTTKL